MANRYMVRNVMTLEKAPVDLFAQIAIGGTGAPTLNVQKSYGILSVSRTGVGAYTINFGGPAGKDTYIRMLHAGFVSVVSSGISTAAAMGVVADNSANASAPGINIKFSDIAGAAVDPASGEVIMMRICLSNSTAK